MRSRTPPHRRSIWLDRSLTCFCSVFWNIGGLGEFSELISAESVRAYSTKPATLGCCCRPTGQTDDRTHTMWAAASIAVYLTCSSCMLCVAGRLLLLYGNLHHNMMKTVDFCHDIHSQYKCLDDGGVDIRLIYTAWL